MAKKNAKIKETFERIRAEWKTSDYFKCELEWKQIQQYISDKKTSYQCGNCDTYWRACTFVNDHENICPKCDTYSQPYLCNPVNWIAVIKYIDPSSYHYLIPNNTTTITLFLNHLKDDIRGDIAMIDDNFTAFLNGMTSNTIDFEYIGFYEQSTKNAYLYITHKEPQMRTINNTLVYCGWKLFCNDDDIMVTLYNGQNHEMVCEDDEYETDIKYLYKYMIRMISDKIDQ